MLLRRVKLEFKILRPSLYRLGFFIGVIFMVEMVQTYCDMIAFVVPVCAVFGFGNMCVSTLLRAAFGGRLVIK